jgi:hypothetical protein
LAALRAWRDERIAAASVAGGVRAAAADDAVAAQTRVVAFARERVGVIAADDWVLVEPNEVDDDDDNDDDDDDGDGDGSTDNEHDCDCGGERRWGADDGCRARGACVECTVRALGPILVGALIIEYVGVVRAAAAADTAGSYLFALPDVRVVDVRERGGHGWFLRVANAKTEWRVAFTRCGLARISID